MAKKRVSADELAWIFQERLSGFRECGNRIPIAIIPTKDEWVAVTNAKTRKLYPKDAIRIEAVQARNTSAHSELIHAAKRLPKKLAGLKSGKRR
jgi:hypothetical protein